MENLARYFIKGGSLNYSGNEGDQVLNDLWQKQRRTLDESQRKAIIQDVERHILEEAGPFIPLVAPFTFIALWSDVKNFAPGISEYGNNNLQEIWLAS